MGLFDTTPQPAPAPGPCGLRCVRNTPPPPDTPPRFDGETYDPARDGKRLRGLLRAVYELMRDGGWRTLADIRAVVGGSEAGVSARLRDLRKDKFGGHTVERRRRGVGLWEYRLNVNEGAPAGQSTTPQGHLK